MRLHRRQLLSGGMSFSALVVADRLSAARLRPAAPRIPASPRRAPFPRTCPRWTGRWWSSGPAPIGSIDTPRIARTSGVEIEYYAGANWVDRPPVMIEPLIDPVVPQLRRDRHRGRPPAPMSGPISSCRPSITAFEAIQTESGPPDVRVVIAATLIRMPRRQVVGTTEIGRTVTAQATIWNSIALAFDEALGSVMKRLVEWTLRTGEAA